MTTILVTGASGFVGSHLAPALLVAGHRVLALVRDEEAAADVARRLTDEQRMHVEFRFGDVTKPDTLPAALASAEAVLHLVALPRDWDGGASMRLVNTEGTRNVLIAARDAGVRRFVHLGALGVIDDPSLHYASSKARAMALVRDSGLDWTILSPSLLFGPRDGFFNLLRGLARMSPGVMPITGNGLARFQPLAITDLARAAVACFGVAAPTTDAAPTAAAAPTGAAAPTTAGAAPTTAAAPTGVAAPTTGTQTIGREFELGGPRYWTYREIVEEVLRGMGSRRLLVPVPVALIRLVAASAELVHLPFPVATDQLRQLRFENIGALDATKSAFGFDPLPMEGALGYLKRRPSDQ